MVLYVDTVVDKTVMRVLMFALVVIILRERGCKGDDNAGVGDGAGECRA